MKKYLSSYLSRRATNSSTQRLFYFGNNLFNQEKKFRSNFIKTSKYSLLTFLPIAGLLQFRRYANIYFLLIAILQSISIISPLDPITGWAPLVFVLGLSMVREGIEDYLRHKSDIEMNSNPCKIYSAGKFLEKKWAEIMVGDIVLVEEMEPFPADLIVLTTNQETGICYMETSSLDGEKNLKARLAPKETSDKFIRNNQNPIFRLEGRVECDPPQSSLNNFTATLFIKEKIIKVNDKQLLFRGAILKNSKWIIGIATYTGEESKIMLNSKPPRYKQSQIETKTNTLILFILLFELLCCIASAVGNTIWVTSKENSTKDYLPAFYDPPNLNGFLMFFTYFLLNNTMIPISLIVSLEMVKLAQAYLIEKDVDLYDPEKKRFAKVMTSSINEELGQIEYIFTDKTGTLTCNKMEFKLALIGNDVFGDQRILMKKNKKSILPEKRPTYIDKKEGVVYSFDDLNLLALIKGDVECSKYSLLNYELKNKDNKIIYIIKDTIELVSEFLKLLSTCHECLLDSEKNENMIRYQGPSPDEITLVDTARHLGFAFMGSTTTEFMVEWKGEKKTIEVLKTFEFNSDRKRMSILLRDDNVIKFYIKGADNVIKQRIKNDGQPFLNEVNNQLQAFSNKGFRTLVLAMRIVEEDEFQTFIQRINQCNSDDRQVLDKLIDDFERNFYLLGCTAVEDKLQDAVPETIHDFLKADIKVWMLTGDKMETAENIGRSCNLIQDHFSVMKVCFNKEKESPEIVGKRLNEVSILNEKLVKEHLPKALLLECDAIRKNHSDLKEILIEIIKNCEAVICFRMIPIEKANMVKLVKENLKKITLSIGDGANDVNMIQEAHIGIGLYGEEGMRAVQASDFALVRFKGLWKLIFVHGKWSYIRISEMILYFFYKNMVFTICQFYFSFYCGYSGMTIYDDYYITFYNMIFTAGPLVVRAIIEQDIYYKFPIQMNNELLEAFDDYFQIGEKQMLKKYYPKLYYIGQKNTLFTYKNFFSWIWQGVVHGLLIFFFCIYFLGSEINNKQGYNSDIWLNSITLYTSIIMVVNIKLAAYTQYWTILTVVTLIITSYGLYFAYIWISDQFSEFTSYQTAGMLFGTPNFYLAIFGCMSIVFSFDLFVLFFKAEIQKDLIEKVKLGVKRGYDRSETFFKDLFEKKQILNESGEISISRLKNEKPGTLKKEKNETAYFKKIEVEIDLEQNS